MLRKKQRLYWLDFDTEMMSEKLRKTCMLLQKKRLPIMQQTVI